MGEALAEDEHSKSSCSILYMVYYTQLRFFIHHVSRRSPNVYLALCLHDEMIKCYLRESNQIESTTIVH